MCRRAEKRSYGEQYESYDKYPLESPEITQAAEGWYEAAEYQEVSHSHPRDQADTGIKVSEIVGRAMFTMVPSSELMKVAKDIVRTIKRSCLDS
jgi:hypothetical protein